MKQFLLLTMVAFTLGSCEINDRLDGLEAGALETTSILQNNYELIGLLTTEVMELTAANAQLSAENAALIADNMAEIADLASSDELTAEELSKVNADIVSLEASIADHLADLKAELEAAIADGDQASIDELNAAIALIPAGPKGDTGATGATGAAGSDGADGAQGEQGIQGDTATVSGTSIVGPAGPQGETGATGAQGEAGADGNDGADGQDGADGADGADGEDGADGANGADGADGADGDVGPQGPQGIPGLAAGDVADEWNVTGTYGGEESNSSITYNEAPADSSIATYTKIGTETYDVSASGNIETLTVSGTADVEGTVTGDTRQIETADAQIGLTRQVSSEVVANPNYVAANGPDVWSFVSYYGGEESNSVITYNEAPSDSTIETYTKIGTETYDVAAYGENQVLTVNDAPDVAGTATGDTRQIETTPAYTGLTRQASSEVVNNPNYEAPTTTYSATGNIALGNKVFGGAVKVYDSAFALVSELTATQNPISGAWSVDVSFDAEGTYYLTFFDDAAHLADNIANSTPPTSVSVTANADGSVSVN